MNFMIDDGYSFDDIQLSDDYLFAAYKEDNKAEKNWLLKKALEIYPYNYDATLTIINTNCKGYELEKELKLFCKMQLKILKDDYDITIKNSDGNFYGIFETRPYMRGLFSLFELYDEVLDDPINALKCVNKIMKVNESDNMGVRFELIRLLLKNKKSSRIIKEIGNEVDDFDCYALVFAYNDKGNQKKLDEILGIISEEAKEVLKSKKNLLNAYKEGNDFAVSVVKADDKNLSNYMMLKKLKYFK